MPDRRARRDTHALNENGMVLCNPRDREAAHRADVGDIAVGEAETVTCKRCLALQSRVIVSARPPKEDKTGR